MTKPTSLCQLLIVEDDEVTRSRLGNYFQREGFQVHLAAHAAAMQQILEQQKVSIVLLDINLPDINGLTLASELRQTAANIGIILVTGRDDEVDRIVGLEVGADDYVTKPFNSRELLARVNSLWRRLEQITTSQTTHNKRFGSWTLHGLQRNLVDDDGEEIALTRAEFEILNALCSHPGEVLNRDRLMNLVTHRSWNPNDRTIDVLIRRLRNKIEKNPKLPRYIKTMHGKGYVFCEPVNII